MCDLDRFRLLTKESLLRQDDPESPAKVPTSPARSISNASRAGTTPKTGTGTRQQSGVELPTQPDSKLEAGQKLPHKLGDYFPTKELGGKPIEEIDEYYTTKKTFVVVARDKTIFRFSTTNSLFLLSPFNPVRRAAIYVLVHPVYSFIILLAIVINCVFMAMPSLGNDYPEIEYVFTAIYTVEGCIKILARGFILANFTYLRDAWNWLDFVVVSLAYFMFFSTALTNVSALRTLRVLRALKTVTTVPGLKTIVGALLEAVKRLRDVMVLTIFVLAIFALVGLQIYRGTLLQKCVRLYNMSDEMDLNITKEEFYNNEANWYYDENNSTVICRNVSEGSKKYCPNDTICIQTMTGNPNYGYTNFDNFGYAFLCAFRLMTQDYWESLYQLVIKANGMIHVVYFVLVILLGSFYLMNVILAIVAMSYDEVRLQNLADEEEEEAEKKEEEEMREQIVENIIHKSPSELSNLSYMEMYCLNEIAQREDDNRVEELSLHSERLDECRLRPRYFSIKKRRTCSIPGTPLNARRRSSMKKRRSTIVTDEEEEEEEEPQGENQPEKSSRARRLSGMHPVFSVPVGRGQSRRERQLSEGDSQAPCNLVPFADDSNAQTPVGDGPDFLSAVAVSPSRRFWRPLCTVESLTSSPVLPTKTAVLDRIANSASPMEVRLFRNMLNRSPSIPQRDSVNEEEIPDTGDYNSVAVGTKLSPRFGQRLRPHDGSIRRRSSRAPSIQSSAVDLNDVVILKTLVDDTLGPHRCSLPNLEKEKPPLKDVLLEWSTKTFCSWTCCPLWVKFEKIVSLIILDAFVELFITICIVGNTVMMAIDTPFKSESLTNFLSLSNVFFTTTFALEAFMKLIALHPTNYFKEGWNIFDFFIVLLSFIEIPLANVKGLSIFRAFRLLRVFKLAKSWSTMNLLFAIIGRTIGALGNLIFVLGIIVFIFAVVGMQMFGDKYKDYRNVTLYPQYDGLGVRWNFEDFLHSFMIVFRVLCGEWIESMWDCMRVNGWKCVPFFLLTQIIASLVVLNLFLALLLSSFGSESLQRREEADEPNKLQEAIDRIIRFTTWVKLNVRAQVTRLSQFIRSNSPEKKKQQPEVPQPSSSNSDKPRSVKSEVDLSMPECVTLQIENGKTNKESDEDDDDEIKKPAGNHVNRTVPIITDSLKDRSPVFDEEPEVNEVDIVYCSTPDDCLPAILTTKLCPTFYDRVSATRFGQIWWKVRCKAYWVTEHKYFEIFIIFMIILSSSTLTLEDVNLKHKIVLKQILGVLDKVFTVIFTLEMLLKWVAFGWKKYFKDAWCWLDFTIVSIALLTALLNAVGGEAASNMQAFKAMRTLRALRPLRAVSRWEGMRVVVNALIQAIPSIFNVLLVCLVFWLIFSIMGVQLFGGRFFKCVDLNGTRLSHEQYPHKDNCTEHELLYQNVSWVNSKINFDNFLNGYLALFQVATYKGWIEIMSDAIDITDVHHQPIREGKVYFYIYFVMFIIVGSFFTLNLFIGVIIENFNVQKKKAGGSIEIFMTDEQKKYYKAMKKMDSTTLQKPIPKPRFKVGLFFYKVVNHQTFDIIIMIFIMLNTFVMCIEYHNQSDYFKNVLAEINTVFVFIFTGECLMKLIALRIYYFKLPWNVFDFVIVVFSIVCMFMADLMKRINFSPTLIRIIRVFRIGRVLRLVKSARGIRTLLFSLFVSLPALFNIALLLIMIMFIYAMVGMAFFSSVPYHSGIDLMFNFETFPQAMMVLFMMCTSAGWNGVLEGLTNNPGCTEDNKMCPKYELAVVYLCSYLMISFLVIVNMYIAVILENFSQATEDVQQGLTQDDFDIFYEKWENYDLKALGFIRLEEVYDFLDEVDPPLGIAKPNRIKLATLEVPIREGDVVYSVDLLDKLTRNFLGTPADEEETGNVNGPKEKAKEKREIVSNTLLRQREHVAARLIASYLRRCATRRRDQPQPERSPSPPSEPSSPRNDNLVEVTSDSRAVV